MKQIFLKILMQDYYLLKLRINYITSNQPCPKEVMEALGTFAVGDRTLEAERLYEQTAI